MLTFKKIKETDKEYAHTEVYSDGDIIGYYMLDKSEIEEKKWVFVNKRGANLFAATQKELLLELEDYFGN